MLKLIGGFHSAEPQFYFPNDPVGINKLYSTTIT